MSWVIAGTAAASVAAGAASGAINRATAKGGEVGYDMPTMDPSPYDKQNQQLMAQIAQQKALNYKEGKLDPGMQALMDQIRKRRLEYSQQEMYGRPGQRGGIMDSTMSMASKGGVGPKAMMMQGSKAMQDYAMRNSQIMNYMDTLAFTGLQGMGQESFDMMNSMPRSSQIPWSGATPSINQPGQPGFDTGLGDVDWANVINSKKANDPSAVMAQYNSMYNTPNKANTVVPMKLNGTGSGYSGLVGYDSSRDPRYNVPAR